MATATQAILDHRQTSQEVLEPREYAVLFSHNCSGYRLADGKRFKDLPHPYGLAVVPDEYRVSLTEAKRRIGHELGHGARANLGAIVYDCERHHFLQLKDIYR